MNFSFEGYAKSRNQLKRAGIRKLGAGRATISRAVDIAYQAQNDFYKKLRQRGREVLDELAEDEPAIVVTARSV
ncbi:MAG: acyl-CoA dehydratase activase-related protein [Actinomycetota bacterium]|nr:acyl-CoA dehydratase activase-related protein [Actinomycetota bacterium]